MFWICCYSLSDYLSDKDNYIENTWYEFINLDHLVTVSVIDSILVPKGYCYLYFDSGKRLTVKQKDFDCIYNDWCVHNFDKFLNRDSELPFFVLGDSDE